MAVCYAATRHKSFSELFSNKKLVSDGAVTAPDRAVERFPGIQATKFTIGFFWILVRQ